MSSRFDILSRDQSIHQHVMLEASAGTGKTFAIENLVVRLLIEPNTEAVEPFLLNRILVVTFTKVATRDLRARIRSNLEKTLLIIKCFQDNLEYSESIPDYLYALQEKGENALLKARQRIESALFTFDQAQIFTIHAFCWRMLQSFAIDGGISLESTSSEDKTLLNSSLMRVVRDFIRTELTENKYSPCQIACVLQLFKGQVEKFQTALFKATSKGLDILEYPSFENYVDQFSAVMLDLKQKWNFSSEKILSDFMLHAPAYKEIFNKSKQIHLHILEPITQFAQLFDQSQWSRDDFEQLVKNGLVLIDVLAPEKKAVKGIPPSREQLSYPDLLLIIRNALDPIVTHARNANIIFARMVKDCQRMMRHYQQQEEMLGFNDLLQQMQLAMQSPLFAEHVRNSFDAVIVDEFQDTDPVQWEIFRDLFAGKESSSHIYLVGDPKQSIYAFRQADIYTYLSAAETLQADAAATLDTNFRSQPSLVNALNVIFESCKDLFPLPRQNTLLPYRPVHAGKAVEKQFSDQGACLQFLVASPSEAKRKMKLEDYENLFFFPTIAKEIIQLHSQDGIDFRRCAILVADRYQAERLLSFLQAANIPALSQRGNNLAESLAVHAMREVLQGMLYYRQESKLRTALGGRLIGMSHIEVLALEDNDEKILQQCEELYHILLSHGFASFYVQFMRSCWHGDGKSVSQRLLEQKNGIEFYREWQDIAELLIEEEAKKNLSVEGVIAFLDELEELAENDDESIKCSIDPEEDGVLVLTSHVSKGLEFDIVFALGLIKRPNLSEKLMPVQSKAGVILEAIVDKKALSYLNYSEELDSEKMRQLYVALTRAKYRLYIPVISRIPDRVDFGTASPIELLLARLGLEHESGALKYDEIYQKIENYDIKSLQEFIKNSPADITMTELKENVEAISYHQNNLVPQLLSPPEFEVVEKPLVIQSFTSLASGKTKVDIFEVENSLLAAPHDFNVDIKNAHTLPAGSDIGVILHTILENLPFEIIQKGRSSNVLHSWIRPCVEGTPYERWIEVIADIVYRTLNTSIQGAGSDFCLAEIDPKRMLRETDFLFSCGPENCLGESVVPGYMKGVIDLFFEHEGKYYLLDWKSNWVGPSEEDYDKENLLKVMEEHAYDLQAKIYEQALQKYLKLFDERPFEEIFGGTYYLFLRGIGPNTGVLRVVS